MLDKIIGMSGNITVHLSDRGEYVIDIDTTYGGQTSLSTLGTVTIGNWRAAIIESAFGGTGVDNGGFTITLAGNLCIEGAITLGCEDKEGAIVSLPRLGRLVNRSEALDPTQNLKDIANISQAYDNIAPVAAKGDIVVFDGVTNWPLPLGNDGQWLRINKEKPLGVEWNNLPMSYKAIKYNHSLLAQRSVLNFRHAGFVIKDDPENKATIVELAQNLKGLAAHEGLGFLVRNRLHNVIATRILKEGYGINISNPDGNDDPVVMVSPTYHGQKSITTVGHIKDGYWGGTIVDPEFGGTGHANVYGISLGGHLHTTAPFSVMQMTPYSPNDKLEGYYVQENSVTLVAEGTTEVWLPKTGTLATVQDSLQVCHNLGDVENKLQAFSNISPTKKRGDMIVRGYGDYDTIVNIGVIGQVLTVVEDEPGLIEWTDPLTILDVDLRIEEQLSNITVEIREAMEPEPRLLGGVPLEDVLEAILMQFDYMKHAGTLPVIKELRTVLDQWTKSKHK